MLEIREMLKMLSFWGEPEDTNFNIWDSPKYLSLSIFLHISTLFSLRPFYSYKSLFYTA